MIDPQVELVRGYADEVAERTATLGASPQGTPGAILKDRTWDEYSVGRDTAQAHLENADGQLANQGATTEEQAARKAKKKAPVK
jgi:DNA-binding ferritin-like protein